MSVLSVFIYLFIGFNLTDKSTVGISLLKTMWDHQVGNSWRLMEGHFKLTGMEGKKPACDFPLVWLKYRFFNLNVGRKSIVRSNVLTTVCLSVQVGV